MPEAPEVQALCTSLAPLLAGKKITRVWMDHPKLAASCSISTFCNTLLGQSFCGFSRYGKYLVFEMDQIEWVTHLKMEGKFLLIDPKNLETLNLAGLPIEMEELDPDNLFSHPFLKKHCHARFHLDSGEILAYVDTRKFGRMYLRDKKSLREIKEEKRDTDKKDIEPDSDPDSDSDYYHCSDPETLTKNDRPSLENQEAKSKSTIKRKTKIIKEEPFVLDKLGKDVLDPTLTGDYLYQKLHKRKIPIKTALLDQSVIAGIGNIYANEILFQAGLHPLKPCKDLSLKEFEKIVDLLKALMKAAMSEGGTTIKSFSHPGGEGHYQSHLQIYQKEHCPKCGAAIEKIQIGQRSAYLCPNCQKLQP